VFLGRFTQIVDVGASFGYYAVGFAQKFPHAAVVAFDIDPWARSAIAGMVAENNVANVSVRQACSPAWLREHLCTGALLISDCEGYERELLCGSKVPALDTATIIVELHENLAPGVSSAIVSRFSSTHTMEKVESRTTTALPLMPPHSLRDDELMRVSTEVRPNQAWIFLRPISRSS
jgi:ribosomal protein L11 methylase PrmA